MCFFFRSSGVKLASSSSAGATVSIGTSGSDRSDKDQDWLVKNEMEQKRVAKRRRPRERNTDNARPQYASEIVNSKG